MERVSSLKKSVSNYKYCINEVNNLISLYEEDNSLDFEIFKSEINSIFLKMNEMKITILLSGEYDKNNCYMEIHSGAGGTEANDWANMIKRMYIRFFEKNNYKYEIISEQSGEEVGIKGCLIQIKKEYAFGMLYRETGVHRLVRISPFDSNKRRHTSFASVLVTPEINTSINVNINDSDLKIDVYRSSGAGGQSVNTTDSAVRITHLPTGLVITCQNERSQIKNKEKALEILKNKIYLLEKKTVEKKLNDLKGNVMDVNFGSQIRNYVIEPYNLVKDLRSNYEVNDVFGILDGNINDLLETNLLN